CNAAISGRSAAYAATRSRCSPATDRTSMGPPRSRPTRSSTPDQAGIRQRCSGGIPLLHLAEDLDDEAARSEEVEGPGPMNPRRWVDLESVLLQTSVDLVHLLPALLDESDVERPGILDLGPPIEVGQCQHHAVLVPEEGDVVIPRLPLR